MMGNDARTAPSALLRAARASQGEGLVRLVLRQAWTELAIAVGRRVRFRRRRNEEAVRAYCAMSVSEFEAINARQRWSNWRTIPRNLDGRLPAGPCRAVDLCCGVGHSTQVLAYCLPPGSEILGLEYNPEFVRAAGRGEYRRADGEAASVSFRSQSVLETFRGADGRPLADESVALVNSCGALGIHFNAMQVDALGAEIARVLKPGGLAALDSGTQGVDGRRMAGLLEARGFRVLSAARSCFLDRFTQICFRKEAS